MHKIFIFTNTDEEIEEQVHMKAKTGDNITNRDFVT